MMRRSTVDTGCRSLIQRPFAMSFLLFAGAKAPDGAYLSTLAA
jgi:hypothetical protein